MHGDLHLLSIEESNFESDAPSRRNLYNVLVPLGLSFPCQTADKGSAGHTDVSQLLERDFNRTQSLVFFLWQLAFFEQVIHHDYHAALDLIFSDRAQIIFTQYEGSNIEYVQLASI